MALFRTTALLALIACALALGAAPADQNTSTRDSAQDMDRSIKAGDDFYHYANGGWLRTATIPAGQPSYDTRAILVARTSRRVHDLIQEAAAAQSAKGSIAQKVGDYYASFMDESSIEAKGMTSLADEMAVIATITDKASLAAYLGTTLNSEVDGLTGNADHIFGVWVNQSFTDSEHYVFPLLAGWPGNAGSR
jgi:putative endopeptidase